MLNKFMIHLQTSPEGIQSEIGGVTTSTYTITINDIGFLISVSCEPVRSDLVRGPIVISEYIGPIVPGMSVLALRIHMFLKIYISQHSLILHSNMVLFLCLIFSCGPSILNN